jgi:hypothetical protein
MFEIPPSGNKGANGYGLTASLMSAIAYDPICNLFRLQVLVEPQAIVLSGLASQEAVRRAREIIADIAGKVPIWDRTICMVIPRKPA